MYTLSLVSIWNQVGVDLIIPRVAMKFAINRKLKLPIANETIISLLFTLYQY